MLRGIVISSRIRLARNVEGCPFSLKDKRADILIKKVYDILRDRAEDNFTLYKMADFDSLLAYAMMERHLISLDLIKNSRYGAVILNEDESISIMLNEEDHIREQCILKGLSLNEAYKKIKLVDDELNREIRFQRDSVGFLTACSSNLGLGLRASVMMFLPALTLTNSLNNFINEKIQIRGVYGEGTDSSGFIYQISNLNSINKSEQELITQTEGEVNKIIKAEIEARNILLKTRHTQIRDKIMRSYGILANCYSLTHIEFLDLIAYIKLGIYYNWLSNCDEEGLEELIIETSPSNILEATPLKKDIFRAKSANKIILETIRRV